MTRREAKRRACWLAALILESSTDQVGWEALDTLPAADRDRVMAGMRELVTELHERGWEARKR